ncbi:MAG: FAD-binding oxidoreductase [Candidatus Humimicrobiaceae bacterium]
MRLKKTSYMFDMILFELADIVGKENVSIKKSDKIAYSVDYYWTAELWHDKGLESPEPDYIVHPENSGQVSRIMKLANEYKIPVTVWGGGAGSQGGALPVAGGIILDTKKLNKIYDIDLYSMTVTTGAGIIMQHLEDALEKQGVSTMHIPASSFCSTLAGFIVHRGTGVLSTRYGKIEDMVISMEAVLPTGEIINTPTVPKTASGPDLNSFFIGSEGTLGIITKVTLVIRKMPETREFQAFIFDNIHTGIEVGRKLMVEGIRPSVIRLYDEAETKGLIKRVLGIDKKGAYLVYGIEGHKEIVDLELKRAYKIGNEYNGEDLGSKMGKQWWDQRYKFFYPPYMFALPQAFGTCDTVATYSNVEKIYWAMKKAAEETFPDIRFIGHFSHWFDWGVMLYARFIFDDPPEDPHESLFRYNKAWNVTVRAALSEGGVINEHHGVGLKLSRMMKEQYGNSFEIIKGLKEVLDPNGILNPYKMGLGVK